MAWCLSWNQHSWSHYECRGTTLPQNGSLFSDPLVTKLQKWSNVLFSWAITYSQSERLFNKSIWIQSITSLEYLLTDGSLHTKRETQSPWHFTRQKAYHMHVFLLSLLYVVWTSQGIFNLFSKILWYVISKIIQVFFILIQEENMKLEDSCSVLYRTFLKVEILLVTNVRVHHMNQVYILHVYYAFRTAG